MKKIIFVLLVAIMTCGCESNGDTGAERWTITGRYCETTNKQPLILAQKEGAICISSATGDDDLDTDELQSLIDLGWEFSFEKSE